MSSSASRQTRYTEKVIRLRNYSHSDFGELFKLDQKCFEPGISYTRRELAWYMNLRGAFTIVGETQDKHAAWQIAGFAIGQQPRRALGHVVTIDVLPGARRTGLGTRLMREIETRLKNEGCETIFLETAVDNTAAIAFYKRLGYYVVKTIPRYYLGKIDALLMAKDLREKKA